MSRRSSAASIVASPVLVGAVTVLITVVAVFLAYQANAGLPFVPTYDLSAELPTSSNLVAGNEVRSGGFRVGLVDAITPKVADDGRTIAVATMKLDKVLEPLARDTKVLVRPRSSLGLKYIELTPGRSGRTIDAGGTIPLANASLPVEFDDLLATFDQDLRTSSRTSLQGFGDALAGRGQSLNIAIQQFPSFFSHLTPVMQNLSNPTTELDRFFLQIGRTAAQVAPVARTQAVLFSNMADTFEAIGRSPEALRATIEKSPPTLDAAIRSFRVQRPFLVDFTELTARLRQPARELNRTLPRINRALFLGQPVLQRSVQFNQRTEEVLAALQELTANPDTLIGLQDLTTTIDTAAPLVNYIAPYQTVCNLLNSFAGPLGTHQSAATEDGTLQRVLIVSAPMETVGDEPYGPDMQDNSVGDTKADRPADVPKDQDPQTFQPFGEPLTVIHGHPHAPAIDAEGNADCQNGQTGFPDGPLASSGRYPPSNNPRKGGGSHVVGDPNFPGSAGPGYTGRDSLDDVP